MKIQMNERAAVAALAAMKVVLESRKECGADPAEETAMQTKAAVIAILKAFRNSGHFVLATEIAKDFEGVWG